MTRNPSLRLAGAACIAMALSMPAFADDTGSSSSEDFTRYDTNADGYIDANEYGAGGMTESDTMMEYDADGDGMISSDEYTEYDANMSGGGGEIDAGSSTQSDTGTDTGTDTDTGGDTASDGGSESGSDTSTQ